VVGGGSKYSVVSCRPAVGLASNKNTKKGGGGLWRSFVFCGLRRGISLGACWRWCSLINITGSFVFLIVYYKGRV
jgi:hypothetical protein